MAAWDPQHLDTAPWKYVGSWDAWKGCDSQGKLVVGAAGQEAACGASFGWDIGVKRSSLITGVEF